MSPQERDARSVNQWVLAHNKGKVLDGDKTRYGVSVEYFVGFVYVDAQAGMSLNLESYCSVVGEQISFTKGPRDDNSRLMLRYDVFAKDCELTVLSETQRLALNLPEEPDWLQYYKVEGQAEIDRLRKIELLHPLRAPGFPDDIQFALIPPRAGMQVETVWGRLIANPQEHTFIVRLLNQPHQDFDGIRLGDYLAIQVKPVPQGISSTWLSKANANK